MICVVLALIIFEVVSRRFFGNPHVWTYEVITFFYAIHFMILGAYTLLHRAHVSIDIIYLRFSPRGQAVLNIITYLLFFFPFLFILLKVGIDSAAASWATKEVTVTARLPIVLPAMKTIMPVTASLLLLQGLSNFIRSLFLVVKGKEF